MVDGGDGSGHIRWYRNKDTVDKLLDEDGPDADRYWMNEGQPSETLTFPSGIDLEEVGFYFAD